MESFEIVYHKENGTYSIAVGGGTIYECLAEDEVLEIVQELMSEIARYAP